jgi:hypothetical protein
MKTSDKILLGLLIVIFTVPFLLATSLKSKVKKGEYVVKRYENRGSQGGLRSGSFAAYKVVKVISADPEFLTCKLTLSNKMDYSYYHTPKDDSVEVFSASDTLFIKYKAETTNEKIRRGYNEKLVNVHLPALTNLVVDGASVIVDSLPASNNLSVTLRNNGEIKDGTEKRPQEAKPTTAVSTKKDKVAITKVDQPKVTSDKRSEVVMRETKPETLDFKELMIFRLL